MSHDLAGLTQGNRGRVHRLCAVVGVAKPRAQAWLLACALPIVATGGSGLYLQWRRNVLQAQSRQEARNETDAEQTLSLAVSCLEGSRLRGYPSTLGPCPAVAARMGPDSGYRFEYLPALPDETGRVNAYFLCARPLRARVTGFENLELDSESAHARAAKDPGGLNGAPAGASRLGYDKAVAYCAYRYASRHPLAGYPRHLADIAACLLDRGAQLDLVRHRVDTPRESFAYLPDDPASPHGVRRFRVYPLAPSGVPRWIDQDLRPGPPEEAALRPRLDRLPAVAAPAPFAQGCSAGRAADCFLAGYEWQRKARQAERGAAPTATTALLREATAAFAQGCRLDDGASCEALAGQSQHMPALALALLEKACLLGTAAACRGAAEIRGASALPAARTLALGLYSRACHGGLAIACAEAAALAKDGDADRLRWRACALGAQGACTSRSPPSAPGIR